MPHSPKGPCRATGCPHLAEKNGYCKSHHKKIMAQYDDRRGTSHERGYDQRWQKGSRSWMSDPDHPERAICAICFREGKHMAADVVDHLVPHRGNYEIFWDEDNWQSLCSMHHNQKTMRERYHY